MKTFRHFLTESQRAPCTRHYQGEPLETGGTSFSGGAAPGVKRLFSKGYIQPGDTVLDFGAGKYGRNANHLREQGVTVYAYDPFHGDPGVSGWEGTSDKQPDNKRIFDITFTSFVINVVPYHIELDITAEMGEYPADQYHITRNLDILDMVKKALLRKDKVVGNFFVEEFADEELRQSYENGTLTDQEILKFCCFGVQTSRGFQRIPYMEDRGFNLLAETRGYKIYHKS